MVEVRGKKYTVLEIIKKSQFPEQDLYVCMSEYGYKECFLAFDIVNPKIDGRQERYGSWSADEEDSIMQMLKQGRSVRYIKENTDKLKRTTQAIENVAYRLKRELNK